MRCILILTFDPVTILLSVRRCCNWGEGSYSLSFGETVVFEGGAFGLEETTVFSTPDAQQQQQPVVDGNEAEEGADCLPVTLELTFDQYSVDTSWDITRLDSGLVVSESLPYEVMATTVEELCLPEGGYSFRIADVYGDGM